MSNFVNIAPENKAMGIHIVHSSHLLGSLSLMGATPERLQAVYESESKILPPPEEPKGIITRENWRTFLGDRQYTREYLDFFTRELTRLGRDDWRGLIELYLLSGERPLVKSLTGDLTHPLIHLAYAYELRNAELATQALTYCAVHYDPQTQVYLDGRGTGTSTVASSPLGVFENIRADTRLDSYQSGPGREYIGSLIGNYGNVILEHWESWPRSENPTAADLCDAFDACVSLLVGTVKDDNATYDFFLLHALTGCHALRLLLPELPEEYHAALFHQWWLNVVMVYIMQGRPPIDDSCFTNYPIDGKDWSVPIKLATEGPAGFDAHYVKTIRAIQAASELGAQVERPEVSRHPDEWYLKAATKFAETFRIHGGFGPVDSDMIGQLMALIGQGTSERHE